MLFITENVPSSLRGKLTKWMLQLKPGVFIGTLSALVGEKLWNKIIEKQGNGGAIWVKASNNEQRYKLTISGKTNWSINDFDGLQLIAHPLKKSIKRDINLQEKCDIIKEVSEVTSKIQDVSKVTWNTEGVPKGFITRKVLFNNKNSKISSSFSGTSNFEEYPPEILWEKPWTDEIEIIGKSLVSFLNNIENLHEMCFYGKKLMCLDIETTNYLPKAYEGFMNIIGVSLIDLREIKPKKFSLMLFQAYNMTREKNKAPLLLKLIKPYLKDVDTLLVFNQDFDIKIINTIISKFSLNITLPKKIVDLQKYFSNLVHLEKFLTSQVGVKRVYTSKYKYTEYYKQFKGKGKTGYNKKIEPIGTYNLTDTLTPLFTYLILKSNKKQIDNKLLKI
ncbi:hypothetical protein LCGC14_0885000 [marine sediment metagenome]|uniref:Uncharacterized protein n=1 Tax=marine sediment metagenome TaxID=412755 RepID=A0A0F9P0V4_9ZZZZ